MTQDGQPTPGSLDALRSRFEEQSRKAQTYYTVMHAIKGVVGNDDAANAWMSAPLPAFEGRTPAELVGNGRAEEVLGHIRTLQPGTAR
ncbi:MbcA/ParS/Xre antitoxin family protein [Massilia niabensis]|uniref:MbcA/ParS/Xre antitoxin family protein n=1 Tax=Massilia niabensis TaxID=544910 RepID=A0ABW0L2D7_9BURK